MVISNLLNSIVTFESSFKTYKYPHDYPNSWVDQQYLPDNIKNTIPLDIINMKITFIMALKILKEIKLIKVYFFIISSNIVYAKYIPAVLGTKEIELIYSWDLIGNSIDVTTFKEDILFFFNKFLKTLAKGSFLVL